jgi:hypothetical protein
MLIYRVRLTRKSAKPFVPYSTYCQPQPQPQPQQQNGQAPLVPTGFIQGEQGTLIPVYQPEALDQYMTSGSHQPPALAPQPQAQNLPAWRQYPQAPTFPFIPIPQMAGQMPAQPGNVGWMPNQQPLLFSVGQQAVTPSFRGGHRMNHAPNRRHRQSTYDRNIPTRPHIRYPASGMNNTEQVSNSDHVMLSDPGRPNVFGSQLAFGGITGAGGWNQWTGAR